MDGKPCALFRADASERIGTGHVMRSLTLANELAQRGWSVAFAARNLPGSLDETVVASGHSLVRLPDGIDYANEVEYLHEIGYRRQDIIVVDHYELNVEWETAARAMADRIVVIDDLADRRHEADVLVNQNLGVGAAQYRDLVPSQCTLLIGSRYALVRPEFRFAREVLAARTGNIRRVLIFMSGSDPSDATAIACRALMNIGDLSVDVVCGTAYPKVERLRLLTRDAPQFQIHIATSRMADLMLSADLAVGAPSSASWERCCVGLPTVLVVLAENQVRVGEEITRRGAAMCLGRVSSVTPLDIERAIRGLRNQDAKVRAMSEAALELVDGLGTLRVADALEHGAGHVSNESGRSLGTEEE